MRCDICGSEMRPLRVATTTTGNTLPVWPYACIGLLCHAVVNVPVDNQPA